MRGRRRAGVLDWLLPAFALLLAAIVLYYSAQRLLQRSPVVATPPAPPLPGRVPASRSLAKARAPEPPGVSPSFQAVDSIPPMALSRTGRPSIRTKAPPPPKKSSDKR